MSSFDPSDAIGRLSTHLSPAHWAGLCAIHCPADFREFLDHLNTVVDRLVRTAEESSAHLQENPREEALTQLLFRAPLSEIGYHVTCEEDSDGHVDLTVKSADRRYVWRAEAKKNTSLSWVEKGIGQLLRYTPGRDPAGALLVYLVGEKAVPFMKKWRKRVQTAAFQKKFAVTSVRDDPAPGYVFVSTHTHPRSGGAFDTRHIGVSLRIARASASSAAGRKNASEEK